MKYLLFSDTSFSAILVSFEILVFQYFSLSYLLFGIFVSFFDTCFFVLPYFSLLQYEIRAKLELKMADHRKLIDRLTSLVSTLKETDELVDTQRNEDPEEEIKNLLPRTEAGLCSTPCVKNTHGETISMRRKKPVFLSFLVKPIFDNKV